MNTYVNKNECEYWLKSKQVHNKNFPKNEYGTAKLS